MSRFDQNHVHRPARLEHRPSGWIAVAWLACAMGLAMIAWSFWR